MRVIAKSRFGAYKVGSNSQIEADFIADWWLVLKGRIVILFEYNVILMWCFS